MRRITHELSQPPSRSPIVREGLPAGTTILLLAATCTVAALWWNRDSVPATFADGDAPRVKTYGTAAQGISSPSSTEATAALIERKGIWTSAAELRDKPMTGPAWRAVLEAGKQDTTHPDLGDNDDCTDVRVLAAAIVYARTGDASYRQRVVKTIQKLIAQGHPQGSSLSWARNSGAYALAADLVGYRSESLEAWLTNIANVWQATDGHTLRSAFHRRSNNWGAHAFGSLCAIYCYLGDNKSLREIREYWIQGVEGPNPGYKYGDDLSWHADENDPRLINPAGSMKNQMNIDGLVPDDMRRGGPFRSPPEYTNYVWEVQQGWVMAARILERAGMPIWDVGDRALYRACHALQVTLGGQWRAKGDDLWMLPFYDAAYGTNYSAGQDVWRHGKNTGWAYVVSRETSET